ncbi:hypertension-related calcium-regulated gene protein [Kipferlia bialata]|uniref:Hypertension-related calcium-regulated gene protein n=1 Tax=Kipferlia bialata TaxID=797122 RepID=A0A9K3CMC8_9EUKA|nr:hypertension-related calcium-regulated gene protein [Kipferlia bialata]|eukprot:g453.t1
MCISPDPRLERHILSACSIPAPLVGDALGKALSLHGQNELDIGSMVAHVSEALEGLGDQAGAFAKHTDAEKEAEIRSLSLLAIHIACVAVQHAPNPKQLRAALAGELGMPEAHAASFERQWKESGQATLGAVRNRVHSLGLPVLRDVDWELGVLLSHDGTQKARGVRVTMKLAVTDDHADAVEDEQRDIMFNTGREGLEGLLQALDQAERALYQDE